MWNDFKAFVMRGNVMDLAVGVIIGAAFGAVIKSLVDDVIMPPMGLATGGMDFSDKYMLLKEGAKAAPPYPTLAAARDAGAVTLNTKPCPYCTLSVSLEASRCPHCTSQIAGAAVA